MGYLCRNTANRLCLVMNEPAIRCWGHEFLGGKTLREKLRASALAWINDGSSHKRSWARGINLWAAEHS